MRPGGGERRTVRIADPECRAASAREDSGMHDRHDHDSRPRYDVHADLRVQELLDVVRAASLGKVAARIETLLGNAGLELQLLRETVQAVRETRDMLTDHFAETEGAAGTKALVAIIRADLTEDLEDVP